MVMYRAIATKQTNVTMSYYPATYYVKMDSASSDASLRDCTVDGSTCVLAPNGVNKLKRYEIKSGNVFPGARTYVEELQNFANWWSYYRNRTLMAAASIAFQLVNSASVRPPAAAINAANSSCTAAAYCGDRGSGRCNAQYNRALFA